MARQLENELSNSFDTEDEDNDLNEEPNLEFDSEVRIADQTIESDQELLMCDESKILENIYDLLDQILEEIDVLLENMDVQLAMPPASEEGMENHLMKTVIYENDEECAICLDPMLSKTEVAVVQMPCMHVFHRTCIEMWLRTSGTCPKCRAVFPSQP